MEKVCIVGSGNWGSTVAKLVGENVMRFPEIFDPAVQMWVFEETITIGGQDRLLSDYINKHHENPKYLPGVRLPLNVMAIPDLVQAAEKCTLFIFVLPHQFVPRACDALAKVISKHARCISLVKGLDVNANNGLQLISDQIGHALGVDVSTLMGANIANEVSCEQFSESTIGYTVAANGKLWKQLFHTDYFQIRLVKDVRGVELCGALKNIVGLAAGITDGLGFGDNTKAAIIRIGLSEMREFSKRVHEEILDETFFESCGVADVITTCLGGRNRRAAEALVKTGKDIATLEGEMLNGQKLQGPLAAKEVYRIIKDKKLEADFPLFIAVYRICFEGFPPQDMIKELSKQ